VNHSRHISIDFQILEEVWSGNSVDYSILRIFECPVYAHVNNGKLAHRAVKCMSLGYASESKGYRMWCPKFKKTIQSRDVTFDETVILSSRTNFVAFSTSAGDREDTSNCMEIEVETVAPQSRATNQPNKETQVTEPGTISSDQPQVEVDYSIAHDRH